MCVCVCVSLQNIVSQIVGALSSHGATGTVSAEATATVSHQINVHTRPHCMYMHVYDSIVLVVYHGGIKNSVSF